MGTETGLRHCLAQSLKIENDQETIKHKTSFWKKTYLCYAFACFTPKNLTVCFNLSISGWTNERKKLACQVYSQHAGTKEY